MSASRFLCAMLGELVKGTTAGMDVAQEHEHSGRASNFYRHRKSLIGFSENSELTTFDTGAVIDRLSIEGRGQRDADFKGSDLQAQLFISA